jgi:hypothetical protein
MFKYRFLEADKGYTIQNIKTGEVVFRTDLAIDPLLAGEQEFDRLMRDIQISNIAPEEVENGYTGEAIGKSVSVRDIDQLKKTGYQFIKTHLAPQIGVRQGVPYCKVCGGVNKNGTECPVQIQHSPDCWVGMGFTVTNALMDRLFNE